MTRSRRALAPARRQRTVLGFAALAVVCGAASAALAQDPAPAGAKQVGVLPPTLGNEVPERYAESLGRRMATGLERGGSSVTSLDDPPEPCDTACQRELGQQAGMTHVVRLSVVKEGPDFKLEMSVVDVATGTTEASVEGICEICGDAELEARTMDLAASLQARIDRIGGSEATLRMEGRPSGARLFVDGEYVGDTPYEGQFEPGEHQLELRARGYAPQKRTWTALPGVEDDLDFTLMRASKQRPAGAFAKPLGWTLVAAGAALLGTGTALLIIDERPHQGTCQSAVQDADGDCPFRYNTQGAGIASVVVGVAAAGSGAGLLVWRARSSDDGSTEAEARINASPLGAGARIRF